jgi:3-oxoacyl-[acyl-carrier protein] reductase
MTNANRKVAIVTGASRGIGASIAQHLARDGFAVVINYTTNTGSAELIARNIERSGGRAMAVQADVSDSGAVRRLFDATQDAFGGMDVLVNNAGIMSLANVADTDDATFDRLMAVNLKGTFNTLREAAARLRMGGRIVNFSSSVVGLAFPTYGVYAAMKAGVEVLTRVLAKELRGRNITVNTVAPGPTETELFRNGKSPEVIEHLTKMAPLERLGQPDDIASVVAFLVGPDARWINGQTVRANGGII